MAYPYNHSYHQPGFVFTNGSGADAKGMSEAGSHEVGHNLGLSHDGTSTLGYYDGHGPWAPIMGVGYYRPVTQWSKGEYADANNGEDDLAVMASNGVARRADDHGNRRATATAVGAGRTAGIVTSRERDWFRIQVARLGQVRLNAKPAPSGPNLDIRLQLYGTTGGPIRSANPAVSTVDAEVATGLNARMRRTLDPGTYHVKVSGTKFQTPSTGYSSYASMGAYTVAVRLP